MNGEPTSTFLTDLELGHGENERGETTPHMVILARINEQAGAAGVLRRRGMGWEEKGNFYWTRGKLESETFPKIPGRERGKSRKGM